MDRARAALAAAGYDAMLIGAGADLLYLTGYDALPLERMTLLVVPVVSDPFLIVPELERLRAEAFVDGIQILTFGETDEPVTLVRDRLTVNTGSRIAISDRLWAMFVLPLQLALRGATWSPASSLLRPLRMVKDAKELDALARAGAAADRVAAALTQEKVSGRTEREVSRWISDALVDAGTARVNFAIVAAGQNAASPHHEPSDRVIKPGDALVCDFGGTLDHYCSDITRTFFVGDPPRAFEHLYGVLHAAQEAACIAVKPGVAAEDVDAAARTIIAEAGYGDYFIHRTGHGIGLEEHEHPYIVSGNREPIEEGMTFSVEPGIYIPGSFGARIEDIVACDAAGVRRLNNASHDLHVLS